MILKDWQPITLLNISYKVISCCLSLRIKCTGFIISNSYTVWFIKGRYTGENTRFVYDLMSYIVINDIPGFLVVICKGFWQNVMVIFLIFFLVYENNQNMLSMHRIQSLNTNFSAWCILQCLFCKFDYKGVVDKKIRWSIFIPYIGMCRLPFNS